MPEARNALPADQVGHAYVAQRFDEQIPVQVRVLTDAGEQWVPGLAKAWTDAAVWVWWADGSAQHPDWLPADDVRRAT